MIKKNVCFLLCSMMLMAITACNLTTSSSNAAKTSGQYADVTTFIDEDAADDDVNDTSWSSSVISIIYNGDNVTINNPYDGNGVSITNSNANVVVTSTTDSKVVYSLSGSSSNGSFKLYSNKKYRVQLSNLNVTSADRAVINIQSKKRGFIEVVGTNSLTDPNSYTSVTSSEDMKGCVFSEGQLIFCGTGALTVTANAKHGLASDDYIRLAGPEITVAKAASDAIHTKDYFIMDSGSFTCTSVSGNAIECSDGHIVIQGGTIVGTCEGDGIKASYEESDEAINPFIIINGGNITINTSGEKSHGILTKSSITVAGNAAVTVNVTGDGSKCIKSGGLIQFGSADGSDKPTLRLNALGSYLTEDGDYTLSSCVSAGTSIKSYNADIKCSSTCAKGRGFAADGNVEICDGTYEFTLTGACLSSSSNSRAPGGMGPGSQSSSNSGAPKGIKAVGTVVISGGEIVVTNTYGKGLACEGSLTVNGGQITVTTGHEGIESKSTIVINDGQIYSYAADDAINAGGNFTINGGCIYGCSTGNDGLDANGNLYVKGGVVYAISAGSPEVAFDANTEDGYKLYVSGGTIIAIGGLEQGASLTQSCYQTSSWSKNTKYALTVGDRVYAFTTPSSGGSGMVVSGSSTPSLSSGVTVSGGTNYCNNMINIGGTVTGGTGVNLSTYTSSSSGQGDPGGQGGFGGRPGAYMPEC